MAVTKEYDKDRRLSIAAAPAQEQNTVPVKTPKIASNEGIGTAATYSKPHDGKPQYTPGQSVTDAKAQMEQSQQKQPGAYQQSDAVTAAQQALDAIQSGKPQGYESKYGSALDGIMQQIQNPQKFKYEFNGDELFKYYADLYTQKGKQASADAMGQAAALTGGYGNSYAQQVGNQAYDQYLLSLYDKGMDLRDRAYQQYQDQRNDVYNQYNVLNAADAQDYNRYRDTVGDWENERDYLTGRYDNERNIDYSRYNDDYNRWLNERDYYTGRYDNERNIDYSQYTDQRDYDEKVREFDAQMQENIRQFNESLNWDKMSSDQKYAAEYAMQILANGQMPSAEMLEAAGLSAEDAQKLMAQIQAGGSGNGKKKSSGDTKYVREVKPGVYEYVDENGNLIPTLNFDGTARMELLKNPDLSDPNIRIMDADYSQYLNDRYAEATKNMFGKAKDNKLTAEEIEKALKKNK